LRTHGIRREHHGVTEVEHRPRPFGSLRDWWEKESRRPTGGSPAARVAQLSRRRSVLQMLIIRDLKKRYENSYLGYAWTLLEPAMLLAIYYFVFKHLAGAGQPDYLLFMACAMMPWLWFRNSVRGGSSVINKNSRLVTSINLPREIYPLALSLTEFVEYLITLPMVAAFALWYGRAPTWYLALLPLVMLLQFILVTGAALLMSALATMFQDIDRILSSLLRVMFYLTPVIYPTGRIHNEIGQKLFVLDPLVGIFELHRKVFYPDTEITGLMLTVSIGGSLLVFVVGWAVFMRLERAMLKEL
jgi:ABC-2 type transport system permease protein